MRKRLQDARHIEYLAQALYRFDKRDPHADFFSLDPVSRDRYRSDAAVLAYMRDRAESTPAFYFAADLVTPGGLGSLPRLARQSIVTLFDVAFCAFRKALARDAGIKLDHLDRLALLAEADTAAAAVAKQQPVEPLSIDVLAGMATTSTEVH